CFWIMSASREHEWHAMSFFLCLWMQWMFLSVVIAATLWGSVVFAAPSSNATIILVFVLGILLLGSDLGRMAAGLHGPTSFVVYGIYFAMPHLEFFDVREMLVQHRALEWQYCAGASLYALAYAGLFLLATWFVFRRKALQR